MRLKKIFIVSLVILAILTIGAAAASENVTSDDLASDAGDVEIQESIADEDLIGAEGTNESEDVLGVVNGENTIKNEETTGENAVLTAQNTDKEVLSADGDVKYNVKFIKRTGKYKLDTKVYFKVTDAKTGEPVKGVTILLTDGLDKEWFDSIYSNSNGIAVWDANEHDAVDGSWHFKARIDDNYGQTISNVAQKKFTISPYNVKIIAKKLKVPKKSRKDFKIKVIGPDKKPVKWVWVKFVIYTGKKHITKYCNTNSKGVAAIGVSKLSSGKHKVKIKLDANVYHRAGDYFEEYDNNNGIYSKTVISYIIVTKQTAKIPAKSVTVKPTKLSTKYKSGKYFKAKVINSNTKKPVKGVKISLKIGNSKKVTLTSNSNGWVKYSSSNLKVGTYKVTLKVVGKKYKGKTKTSSIKITKAKKKTSTKKTKSGKIKTYIVIKDYGGEGVHVATRGFSNLGVSFKAYLYDSNSHKRIGGTHKFSCTIETDNLKGFPGDFSGTFGEKFDTGVKSTQDSPGNKVKIKIKFKGNSKYASSTYLGYHDLHWITSYP